MAAVDVERNARKEKKITTHQSAARGPTARDNCESTGLRRADNRHRGQKYQTTRVIVETSTATAIASLNLKIGHHVKTAVITLHQNQGPMTAWRRLWR